MLLALLLYWDAIQLHVCMRIIQHKDKLIKTCVQFLQVDVCQAMA